MIFLLLEMLNIKNLSFNALTASPYSLILLLCSSEGTLNGEGLCNTWISLLTEFWT